MSNLHRLISIYPYWDTPRTQDPLIIVDNSINTVLRDLDQNQEPLRTDFNHDVVPVVMRPRVGQDTSQITNYAGGPVYGVTNPGGLYTALLDSVPDPIQERRRNGS